MAAAGIYYRFKSAKDFEVLPLDAPFITVACLKQRIFERKRMERGTDHDFIVTNAQTNEEYVDEEDVVFKSMAVLIRRVPGPPRKPIVVERENSKADEVARTIVSEPSDELLCPFEKEWDEFVKNGFAVPEVLPAIEVSNYGSKSPDEGKTKDLSCETPARDGRHAGRVGHDGRTPPRGYVCHRCSVPGHFIQHCPTNGDPNYNVKWVQAPTDACSSLMSTATPDGRSKADAIPPELRCPLCKEAMTDAVFASRCCFRSFCDVCIRDRITRTSMCLCGATHTMAAGLIPNITLRETIDRVVRSTALGAGAEKGAGLETPAPLAVHKRPLRMISTQRVSSSGGGCNPTPAERPAKRSRPHQGHHDEADQMLDDGGRHKRGKLSSHHLEEDRYWPHSTANGRCDRGREIVCV